MPSLTTLVDGTVPVANDFNGNFSALNAAIGTSTSISAWAIGEMPYASATNTLARLSPGANGTYLSMASGIPAWTTGAWTSPAFSAGDYPASGSMTWTVASGDVISYSYLQLGKTMFVEFNIQTTTVGGTPSNRLKIKIPNGQIAAKSTQFPIRTIDNNSAPASPGFAEILAAGTTIDCCKDATQSNWSASTDLTYVAGTAVFEVQ